MPSKTLRRVAEAATAAAGEIDAQGVVEIVCADLDTMLAFYHSLGFRTERRAGPFAVVSGFGVRLFLAENPAAKPGKRWANIRIMVAEVDLVWRCVTALGLPTGNDIADRPYGLRDFLVIDPGGFEVRFAQLLG